ncbi:MAG: peptidoglycan DD-metalloendopeptidase family protein [Coxiellaceae bacterium]|nr:peptidoglycan DD-metalloendopeptidase family protein [Coxiellaceae bacterium]
MDKPGKNIAAKQLRIIGAMMSFFVSLVIVAVLYNQDTPPTTAPAQQSTTLTIPQEAALAITDEPIPTGEWQTATIRKGDSLTSVFARKKLPTNQLIAIMSVPEITSITRALHPGNTIDLLLTNDHQLLQLVYKPDIATEIVISHHDNHFQGAIHHLPVEHRQQYSHATIRASLFNAGIKANIPCKLIMQLVDIFQWDVDFASDIRAGDSFDVIYDQQYVNGEPVATGNILAATFINRGKEYNAIRYEAPDGDVGYYTITGRSLKRAFTRTPVKFTRISSYFKPRRWHPVLHRFRKHTGVDYAAPAGTPIKATGNGRIAFIGRKGGYGNAIIIDHGNKVTTLYGHMLRFAKDMTANKRVTQGQVIGYVGMTGLATGYHLHYEFRIDNKHHDPLTVALPKGLPVAAKFRKAFFAHANQLLKQMATHQQIEFAGSVQNNKV